jgi:hypothetical protein
MVVNSWLWYWRSFFFSKGTVSCLRYIRRLNSTNVFRYLLEVDRLMRRSRKRSRSASVAEFDDNYSGRSLSLPPASSMDGVIAIGFSVSWSESLSMPIQHGLKRSWGSDFGSEFNDVKVERLPRRDSLVRSVSNRWSVLSTWLKFASHGLGPVLDWSNWRHFGARTWTGPRQ